MPRTITYSDVRGQPGDDYLTKVVKYVPGEVLSFFLLVRSVFGSGEPFLVITIIACLLGTPLYLFVTSLSMESRKRPYRYSYALAVVAFAAWAVGTSTEVDALLGIDKTVGQFLLFVTVFLLPGIDTLLQVRLRG
ncbi:MAG: hypothetical protein JOZ81_32650 [Chloroflexi bacterium]|nr:hypothetical protein [Chloroflexota bacterium]MBV9545119.1 hypothetical protein [Chloroflexota bacterium]